MRLLALLHLAAAACAPSVVEPARPTEDDHVARLLPAGAGEQAGRLLFRVHCAGCHGPGGRGDGPATTFLDPAPRDFTRAVFKYTSTGHGAQPTREGLLRVVTEGVPGTSMGGFPLLSLPERKALVEHVRGLALRGRARRLLRIRELAGEPAGPAEAALEVAQVQEEFATERHVLGHSAPPADVEASREAGRRLYEDRPELCATCHGPEGRGDGPQAPGLEDLWGRPNPPRDFTTGVFRGGTRPLDVFTRIKAGVGGTSMPAFAADLTDEEIWNLTHFLLSLSGQGRDAGSR